MFTGVGRFTVICVQINLTPNVRLGRKQDILSAITDVRFVPTAEIGSITLAGGVACDLAAGHTRTTG
jgi:hypothetical protein